MGLRIDTIQLAAVRKLKAMGHTLPPNWSYFTWEDIGGALVVKGSEEYRLTKGPNKGRRGWRGPKLTVVVTNEEQESEKRRYEDETGKCYQCQGDGQMWIGWNHESGSRFGTCIICAGTGDAQLMDTTGGIQ